MVTPVKLPSNKGFILAQDGGRSAFEDDSVISEVITRRESIN